LIHTLEVFREGESQAELRGNLIAPVGENVKAQLELLVHVFAECFELWSNDYKRGFGSLDLRQDFIQSFQLQIAIRSPNTAKEA
jgi:hypothetical protein